MSQPIRKTAEPRSLKRIVIIEGSQDDWRQFLALTLRHGYQFIDDPQGVLDDLPRPVTPNVPSPN
jgi:hypothetical protein